MSDAESLTGAGRGLAERGLAERMIARAREISGSRATWTQRGARAALFRVLGGLREGSLVMVDADGRRQFGDPDATPGLRATLRIVDPEAYLDIALGGTIGAGESYMDGGWHADDLAAVTRIFVRNRDVMMSMDSAMARAAQAIVRKFHDRNANTRDGSRRNIQAHYDLGNEFFSLFLDETMAYSSGIFERPDATLHEAQLAKFDAICRDLELAPGMTLLEIGTGWGGFAMHAARTYGAQVTTTTISQQQFDWASRRVREEGLGDRVEVVLRDYRDLGGRDDQAQFDRIVSIEMIEAVGHQYYDTYFAKCGELLRPGGRMGLQAITIRPEFYESARDAVDFIQTYVFPGSCIPSEPILEESARRAGGLERIARRDITEHYVTTLQRWCDRLLERADDVRALGNDDTFLRLWEFYFRYCEGGFAERATLDVQWVLEKPAAS